ncbi:MAG TPA: hypothetical protein VFT95_20370 [Micromonosporaceae bacterium]|nr:hypothetical protein [Micromonosporaceae bacterium]
MRIPVFVSMPTVLSDRQLASRRIVERLVRDMGLEERRLGESDYPHKYPLKEVYAIARHCSGGLILGFEQMRVTAGLVKPETPKEEAIGAPVAVPTPWNNLEAGILFGLGLPLMIFREKGVSGGVFDNGVTDVFVHRMPTARDRNNDQLKQVFRNWQAEVRHHYYEGWRGPVDKNRV